MVDGHLASFKNGDDFAAVVDKLVQQTEAKPSGTGAFWVGATVKASGLPAARWAAAGPLSVLQCVGPGDAARWRQAAPGAA
jgi:hypothetical protein